MIYIADITSVDVQHEQFNSSFIGLVKRQPQPEQITFFADPSHSAHLSAVLQGVQQVDIDIYKKRGGIKEFIRAYHQFQSLRRIITRAEKNNVSRLIVLLIHPFAHYLFKTFSSSTVPVTIVIHGELESVKFNKHFVNKIWGWFLKTALIKRSKSVGYVILGQSIYQNLIKVLPPFKDQRSVALDHPYPFVSKPHRLPHPENLVFASLGVATTGKNSQYLFSVAAEASRLGYGQKLKFRVCGRVYQNMEKYLNPHVKYKEGFKSISRDELDKWIDESDFAVFYYDNINYSLCSSGAFWDAVNSEVPLMYVNNDYFSYYAGQVGEIGYAFDNAEALNSFILNIPDQGLDQGTYQKFLKNIRSLKYEHMDDARLASQISPLFEE